MILLLLQDFQQKNTEHMQPEVVSLLRSSERAFLHHLVASNPEALFRWGVLRATFRILTVFKNMGRKRAELSKSLLATKQAAFSGPKKTIDVCLQDSLVTAYQELHVCLTDFFSITISSTCFFFGFFKKWVFFIIYN